MGGKARVSATGRVHELDKQSSRIWTFMDGDWGRYENSKQWRNRSHRFDQLWYTFSVTYVFLTIGSSFSKDGRAYIPWIYVISLPIGFIQRYSQYKKRKWQYFMLDFCYFANLYFWLVMVFWPDKGISNLVCFYISNSILPWTVVLFKNAMVFHSIDKAVSLYIHAMPMLAWFIIRWFPEDASRLWHQEFKPENAYVELAQSLNVTVEEIPSTVIIFGLPAMVSVLNLVQQTLEIYFVLHVTKWKCFRGCLNFGVDDKYLNLYRYVKSDNGISKFVKKAGEDMFGVLYVALNGIMTFVVSLPVYLYFTYYEANLFFVAFIMVFSVHNGSRFYVDVFSLKFLKDSSVKVPNIIQELEEEMEEEEVNAREKDIEEQK